MPVIHYLKRLSKSTSAIAIAAGLATSAPLAALTVDPETGAIEFVLPTDLCTPDFLPAGLLDKLVDNPAVNRYYYYMVRECPEKAFQLADLTTAAFDDDDTPREDDEEKEPREPDPIPEEEPEEEIDDEFDEEFDEEFDDECDQECGDDYYDMYL